MSRYKQKKYYQRTNQTYLAKAHLTRRIPIGDQSIIISREIIEDVINEAVEKAQMKEFVRSAPGHMSSILLSFSELCLCQSYPQVETTEPLANIFGSNINTEPEPIIADNWIRKTMKIKEKPKTKKSKGKKVVSSLGSMNSLKSKGSRRRKNVNQFGRRTRSRLQSMSSKTSNMTGIAWDKIVVPEPVKIDNNLEQDFIAEAGNSVHNVVVDDKIKLITQKANLIKRLQMKAEKERNELKVPYTEILRCNLI